MNKIYFGILLSAVFSIIFSTYLPMLDWDGKVATLYAVAGIMFSIGMSIIVTSSFSKVKNIKIRNRIKNSFSNVRNSLTWAFLIDSLIYMFHTPEDSLQFVIYNTIKFNYSAFVGICMIFSILFFIINFLELQRLNNDIDEELGD